MRDSRRLRYQLQRGWWLHRHQSARHRSHDVHSKDHIRLLQQFDWLAIEFEFNQFNATSSRGWSSSIFDCLYREAQCGCVAVFTVPAAHSSVILYDRHKLKRHARNIESLSESDITSTSTNHRFATVHISTQLDLL